LKADQKAWFMSRHGSKLRVDMNRYFDESFDHLHSTHDIGGDYILIDLSSVVDRKWHRELIACRFSIRDIYEFGMYTRDATSLCLIEYLGPHLAALRVPMIFFVDRFISLADNATWTRLRDTSCDIVVDRNANVRLYRDLISEIPR
ncbi:MAG: hypothetical protein ACREMY_07925, partial [bacterium]